MFFSLVFVTKKLLTKCYIVQCHLSNFFFFFVKFFLLILAGLAVVTAVKASSPVPLNFFFFLGSCVGCFSQLIFLLELSSVTALHHPDCFFHRCSIVILIDM